MKSLEHTLPPEFAYKYTFHMPNRSTPLFDHIPTGIEFAFIQGGQFSFGLSGAERATFLRIAEEMEVGNQAQDLLRNMKPARMITVPDFMISTLPVSEESIEPVVEIDWDLFRPDFDGGRNPQYLNRAETEVFCRKFGWRQPRETEWEYCYRAGTDTLFPFGDDPIDDIEVFVSPFDVNLFHSPAEFDTRRNGFGLMFIGVTTWCEEAYLPGDGPESLPAEGYAIRGGATAHWPWQADDEWMLCVSAMRYSSRNLEDETAALRVVQDIPTAKVEALKKTR